MNVLLQSLVIVALVVPIIIGLLLGSMRGLRRSIIRIVLVALSIVLAFVLKGTITDQLMHNRRRGRIYRRKTGGAWQSIPPGSGIYRIQRNLADVHISGDEAAQKLGAGTVPCHGGRRHV